MSTDDFAELARHQHIARATAEATRNTDQMRAAGRAAAEGFAAGMASHTDEASTAGEELAAAVFRGARRFHERPSVPDSMTVGRTAPGQCDRCHAPLTNRPIMYGHWGRLNRRQRVWEFCSNRCLSLWLGPVTPPDGEWFPGPDDYLRWTA